MKITAAATLQVVVTMPNVQIQEMFALRDALWQGDLTRLPIAVIDGKVQISQGPGLGIEPIETSGRDASPACGMGDWR